MTTREFWAAQADLIRDTSALFSEPTSKRDLEKKLLVDFTLLSTYKGEFGFDKWDYKSWEQKKSQVSYVRDGDTVLPVAGYQNSKKDTIPMPYRKYQKNAIFLTIKAGSSVELNMNLVKQNSDTGQFSIDDFVYIEAKFDSKITYQFNGSELKSVFNKIDGIQEDHNLFPIRCTEFKNGGNKLTIKIAENFYFDEKLVISIYYKQKDKGMKLAGEIVYCPNKPVVLPIRLVVFEDISLDDSTRGQYHRYVDYIERNLGNYLKTSALNQALIDCQIEKGKITLYSNKSWAEYIDGTNTNRKISNLEFSDTLLTDRYGNKVDIDGNIEKYKDYDIKLWDQYLAKEKSMRDRTAINFNGIVLLLLPFTERKGSTAAWAKVNPLDNRYAIVFASLVVDESKTVTQNMHNIEHEIGHALGLSHTFSDRGNQDPIGIFNSLKNKIEEEDRIINLYKNDIVKIQDKAADTRTNEEKEKFIRHNAASLKKKEFEQGKMIEEERLLLFSYNKTDNFMDYFERDRDKTIIYGTFFWQWQTMRDEVIKYYQN